MLIVFWQAVIGVFVAVALVVATARLAQRGPSRMRTALLVTGTAVMALIALGALTSR